MKIYPFAFMYFVYCLWQLCISRHSLLSYVPLKPRIIFNKYIAATTAWRNLLFYPWGKCCILNLRPMRTNIVSYVDKHHILHSTTLFNKDIGSWQRKGTRSFDVWLCKSIYIYSPFWFRKVNLIYKKDLNEKSNHNTDINV